MAKMKFILLLVLYFCYFHVTCESELEDASAANANCASTNRFPAGSVHNCPTNQLKDPTKPLLQMNVLPGLGFDNLRNLDLGQVYNYNFSTCKISGDGTYLIPDSINLIPIMHSQLDYTAEVFDDMSQWKSETAYSINADASTNWGLAHISASFSMDYQTTKSKMFNDQSRMTRIGIRHRLYSVDVNPDAQLNPLFKSRIFEIAVNVIDKNKKIAQYLAELLVRDYGTHVISGIDVGAIFSLTTMFQGTFEKTGGSDHLAIKAAASVKYMMNKVNLKTSYDKSDQTSSEFEKKSTSSYTTTHGGPPFKLGNFSYEDWEAGIEDHLVSIDRRGVPLYMALTPDNVQELQPAVLLEVSDYIEKAIFKYYKMNTVPGCMNYTHPSANFYANVPINCDTKQQNMTFGSVYQVCQNDHVAEDVCTAYMKQDNIITHDVKCPQGYYPIQLCEGWHSYKHDDAHDHAAHYQGYWCALRPNTDSSFGVLFGGVYSNLTANIVTGGQSCPPLYQAERIGLDVHVCVSVDPNGYEDSIKFGGFYSCSFGNPFAASAQNSIDSPQECPPHFNAVRIQVFDDCMWTYCTDLQQVRKMVETVQSPHLPPFSKTIKVSNVSFQFSDVDGKIWAKTYSGQWVITAEPGERLKFSDSKFAGVIAGTAVGSAMIVIVIWGIGTLGFRIRKRQSKKKPLQASTSSLPDENTPLVIN